ncbi:unnamed protein product [Macrosiphum euphorbiae]|uniref:Transposase n=1 Tax=Macrosiphum euphorbiae TaxID=13131 RepID=A0AAV0YCZ6_9HEMI|nr:unnamed protein product [Macrosiphum euphorbiae]
MPKFPYKPNCSLSKSSQRRRANKSKFVNKTNIFNTISSNAIAHNDSTLTFVSTSDDIVSTSNNQSVVLNNLSFETMLVNNQSNCGSQNMENVPCLNSNIATNSYKSTSNDNNSRLFQFELASFIISARLARSNATKLLKLLKSVDSIEYLRSLPMDSRTLLSTPRSGDIAISTIEGGEYIHFGIMTGLINLYNLNPYVRQLCILELWFNIDGLPIFKKGKSLWPILCGVCVKNAVKPFIVGAYYGAKKPQNVDEYLSPFICELLNIINFGVQVSDSTLLNVQIKGLIADAPARAFLKQIKSFSGYFGCEKCIEEGEYLSGSVCFPKGTAQLRTDESFVLQSNEEHHLGMSPLLKNYWPWAGFMHSTRLYALMPSGDHEKNYSLYGQRY